MTSKFDVRGNADYRKLIKQFPTFKHEPLINVFYLEEVFKVFEGMRADLDRLIFPINSAGELMDKLQAGERTFVIADVDVDAMRMVKYMPAYYFPIFDMANFVEKMAELVRDNLPDLNVFVELKKLKRQLRGLKFPIASAEEFAKLVDRYNYEVTFQGARIDIAAALQFVPADFFPVDNEEEFYKKVGRAMRTRPLIQGHEVDTPIAVRDISLDEND
ncbi:MAG: hypothetical protein AAFW60_08000 [Pseudomonadota bacterium]